MKKHIFNDYIVTLHDTGKRGKYGKAQVKYTFSAPEGEVLFKGDDFFPSPSYDPEGIKAAQDLLAFLTCGLGDVEEEYFKDYTPRQIRFRDSRDREELTLFILRL